MNRRRSLGLTMIELAIALAVLAILGAVALPSMGARLERQRLASAAQALAADLSNARFEAARAGRPLHVHLQSGAGWCWAVSAEPGCGCGAGPQACQVHQVQSSEFPSVQMLASHHVVLDPSGRAEATTVATLQSSRGERVKVDMTPLGRARVCAEEGKLPQMPAC